MTTIISPEQAISEGTTAEQLLAVAEWHDERADGIKLALKRGRNRAFGDFITDADRLRYLDIAKQVRAVAAAVRDMTERAAA